jgi:hypothetical protein
MLGDDDDARTTRTGRSSQSQKTSRTGGDFGDAPPLPRDFADTIATARTKGGASMAPSRAMTRGGGAEGTLSSRLTKDDRTLASRAPTQRTAAYDDMRTMKSTATGASRAQLLPLARMEWVPDLRTGGQTLRSSKSAANLRDKDRFTISDYADVPDLPGREGTMRTQASHAPSRGGYDPYDDDLRSMKTTKTGKSSATAMTGRTSGTSRTGRTEGVPSYYPGPNTR